MGSNVTLYGYPGVIITQPKTGSGIKISKSKNVIIRNLSVKGVGAIDEDDEDCLQINHEAKNIWIDHVHVYDGHDGNMDIVNQSDYITVSWSKFTYTSASKNHQFSNLFGNSDSKTDDANALKITVHHNWWGDGVKERMPRVRFGQVHVVNNLYTSSAASYCVRAGMKANIRVENNVFIGVKNPLDYNSREKEDAKVSMIGNYFEKTSGNTTGQGTAFTPTYKMGVTDVSNQSRAYALRDSIQAYAGPTLPAPGSNEVTPVSSPAVTSSCSATAPASSATSNSSTTPINGTATLTKHGSGSATQTVAAGSAIESFYFSIEGATGATATGLPEGVTGTLKGSEFHISGTVAKNAESKAYNFTVTTTGATTNATKNGTITVTGGTAPVAASSSSIAAPASSAEIKPASSDAKPTSSEEAQPASSETAKPESSETTPASSEASKPESSSAAEPATSSSTGADAIKATVSLRYSISTIGHTLHIEGAAGNSLAIFDMQGRLLNSTRIQNNSFETSLPRTGTYLVRVGQTSHVIKAR